MRRRQRPRGCARDKGESLRKDSSWRGNFRFSLLSSNERVGRGRLLPGFVSSLLAGGKKKKERGERKRPDIQPDSQRAAGLPTSPFIELRSGNPTREAVIRGRGAGAARPAHSGAAVPGAPWIRGSPRDPANAIQVNARGPGPGRGGSCAPGCASSAAPAGVRGREGARALPAPPPYIPLAARMANEMQMSSPPIWRELSQRSHFSKPSSQWIAKWSVSCKMCNPPPRPHPPRPRSSPAPAPSPRRPKRTHLHSCKTFTARIPSAPEAGAAARAPWRCPPAAGPQRPGTRGGGAVPWPGREPPGG